MILVFGRSGQVAREIARLLPDARFLSRGEANFSNPDDCAQVVREVDADAVINAAAYTAVDLAESYESEAALINAEAPGAIAKSCADKGIPIVHLSTDYVFGGDGAIPHLVEEEPDPRNAYGRTKWLGEQRVRESGANYAILRTSWVFSAFGNNFVKTMLRLSEKHDRLDVVGDQIGGPTPAGAIASAAVRLSILLQTQPEKGGTYHLSGVPDVSWADFARAIFAESRRSTKVREIATSDYPTAATRPLNSRLDCRSLSGLGLERPDWRVHLRAVIGELEAQ